MHDGSPHSNYVLHSWIRIEVSGKEVNVKGKICFIVLSVILAVCIGFSSDIGAYVYTSETKQANRNGSGEMLVATETDLRMDQSVGSSHLEEASNTVDSLIATSLSAQSAYVVTGNSQAVSAKAAAASPAYADKSSSDSAAEEVSEDQSMSAEQLLAALQEMEANKVTYLEPGLNVQTVEKEPLPYDEDDFENELRCLQKIVMAEAGSEDIVGQIMVANVILNRVKTGRWGDSIQDVVFAEGQFSPVEYGGYWAATPTSEVKEACERALLGEDYSDGALYFCSGGCWFDYLTYVKSHGGHYFFK